MSRGRFEILSFVSRGRFRILSFVCPEVGLGYRLGRLLILLISPPVRHKVSPGRGRHRRRGRDRWNRRADVVGPTIVTISEKHKRRRSRSHNTKTCAAAAATIRKRAHMQILNTAMGNC